MNQALVVQELAIVIAVKDHNPAILTPEFLKYSGIVPTDWELARPPLYTNRVAQVTFQNGISIIAEPQRVMFLEAIGDKDAASVLAPGIARKYVQTLPNVEYSAVGINPRGFVPFDASEDAARKYITEKLLSPGSWHEVGNAAMRATLNFTYTLERRSFNLGVTEAALQLPDVKTLPIVLFSGNFSYDIASSTDEERLHFMHQILDNWQADMETYSAIVNTKFLAKGSENKTLVPGLFAINASA